MRDCGLNNETEAEQRRERMGVGSAQIWEELSRAEVAGAKAIAGGGCSVGLQSIKACSPNQM